MATPERLLHRRIPVGPANATPLAAELASFAETLMDKPGASGQVVVVGSINADLVVTVDRHPAPGETVLGAGGSVLPGGKGGNQAVAAARLGADVAMVGAVGDDSHAAVAMTYLREDGVDLSAVSTTPGPTGLAIVVVAATGENSIIVIPGANARVTATDVARRHPLLESAAVVVLQGELPRETVEAAAQTVIASGARLVLNLAPAIDLDPDVVKHADPLVVNEHEASHALGLLGRVGPSDTGGDPVAMETSVASALVHAGVASVVVTLGGAGAVVATANASEPPVHIPAPKVEVRDTTGAGDAFVGALAARLAIGDELLPAVQFAARVGAYTVQRVGTQASYPSTADALP